MIAQVLLPWLRADERTLSAALFREPLDPRPHLALARDVGASEDASEYMLHQLSQHIPLTGAHPQSLHPGDLGYVAALRRDHEPAQRDSLRLRREFLVRWRTCC